MLRNIVLRNWFSISPDRASRFFSLQFALKEGSFSRQEQLAEEYVKHMKKYEDNSAVILGGRMKESRSYYLVFQSQNEIQPHNFLVESPLWKAKLVDKYQIEELEIGFRVRDKELAPKYLRE